MHTRILGPMPDDVIAVVSDMTGISEADIRGPLRSRLIRDARRLAYWACRNCTGASLSVIASALGGRDHTSVIKGARRVESDPAGLILAMKVAEEVQRRFGEQAA